MAEDGIQDPAHSRAAVAPRHRAPSGAGHNRDATAPPPASDDAAARTGGHGCPASERQQVVEGRPLVSRFYLFRETPPPPDSYLPAGRSSQQVLVAEGVLFRDGTVAVVPGPHLYDSLERLFEVSHTRLIRFLDGEQPEPPTGHAATV